MLYMKKAADLNNFPAAKQYISIMLDKEDNKFDSAQYLIKFLQRHKSLTKNQVQSILLDIAISYYNQSDVGMTLKYFLEAVRINPDSGVLTVG